METVTVLAVVVLAGPAAPLAVAEVEEDPARPRRHLIRRSQITLRHMVHDATGLSGGVATSPQLVEMGSAIPPVATPQPG